MLQWGSVQFIQRKVTAFFGFKFLSFPFFIELIEAKYNEERMEELKKNHQLNKYFKKKEKKEKSKHFKQTEQDLAQFQK